MYALAFTDPGDSTGSTYIVALSSTPPVFATITEATQATSAVASATLLFAAGAATPSLFTAMSLLQCS
jgi:hypothetical protein